MKRGRDLFKGQSICSFLTLTIFEFAEIFQTDKYKQIIIDSLKYCQLNLGLKLIAYVIMPNHLHLLVWLKNGSISEVVQSFTDFPHLI